MKWKWEDVASFIPSVCIIMCTSEFMKLVVGIILENSLEDVLEKECVTNYCFIGSLYFSGMKLNWQSYIPIMYNSLFPYFKEISGWLLIGDNLALAVCKENFEVTVAGILQFVHWAPYLPKLTSEYNQCL